MPGDQGSRCLPDVITHNYDPGRGPFLNICGLPDEDAVAILAAIKASQGLTLKPGYLGRRRRTEAWLLSERTRKLGAPPLNRPIYFFLGDMADGADPSRPASIIMPLAAFTETMLTFTYPDSMASLPLATRGYHVAERKPHHGEVFTLREIRDVVATVGMPGDRWKTDPTRRHDRFIECQVWDDRPLQARLKQPVNHFILPS